ncbi:MAG: nitrogen fixation protein [Moorea sp. SIO3I6]|nr:nitrogen fixation protein [Moorena sp. SIO3I6]
MIMNSSSNTKLCPSARPESENSHVFGIVNGTKEKPQVTYLKQAQPLTEQLVSLAAPVTPTEVFRISAPCAEKSCQHFDGTNCRLATQIVENLPAVEENLPACAIRKDCRWWNQEGKAACFRCPQVVTDNCNPSELMREVSTPK